jgi:adenylate kinase family enzyme
VEHFRLTHLSAGEILREEVTRNSGRAALIAEFIKDGKIVPQVLPCPWSVTSSCKNFST